MFKHVAEKDFPSRWSDVVERIVARLNATQPSQLIGALMCLRYVIKAFDFKLVWRRTTVFCLVSLSDRTLLSLSSQTPNANRSFRSCSTSSRASCPYAISVSFFSIVGSPSSCNVALSADL